MAAMTSVHRTGGGDNTQRPSARRVPIVFEYGSPAPVPAPASKPLLRSASAAAARGPPPDDRSAAGGVPGTLVSPGRSSRSSRDMWSHPSPGPPTTGPPGPGTGPLGQGRSTPLKKSLLSEMLSKQGSPSKASDTRSEGSQHHSRAP
ncbi:MAG: hypothetical protein WDW36_005116 [Sanguina aurantia]